MMELFKTLGIQEWRKKRNCCRNNGQKLEGEQSDTPSPNVFLSRRIALNILGFLKVHRFEI